MLVSELYNSIIEEEKKDVNTKSLKIAAKNVAATYSPKALKTGATYLDYSKCENRCAYLYKYGTVHTSLVTKCFRKIVKKKAVKKVLNKKNDIKISCLGGGPGTDIVGIFKALSVYPYMHQRISQATILDFCVGWHHSFNHIISNLINGKVKDIPESFVKKNFKANFLEVDLLKPLPTHVIEDISNADIICMIKFVSAVLGKKESLRALKIIADLFKLGAVILFIDNFQGNVAESVETISREAGLQIILGPDVEVLNMELQAKRQIFGCVPLKGARVTVIGLMKTNEAKVNMHCPNINFMCCDNEDINDNCKAESIDSCLISNESIDIENFVKEYDVTTCCDKYTQTEENLEETISVELQELPPLINALSQLLSVMTKLQLPQQCRSCECLHEAVNHT